MTQMRIVQLSDDCPATSACLLYDYDKDGIPGVLVRAYVNGVPRDRWVYLPGDGNAEAYIARATAGELEAIVRELVDEWLDVRLTVEMAEAVHGDLETISGTLDRIRVDFACDEYAQSVHMKEEAGAPADVALRHFRNGYERAMCDYCVENDIEK